MFFSVVPPAIISFRQMVKNKQGENAILICKITEGLPESRRSWYKNGVLLRGKVDKTLLLANVTDADEGWYNCIAQNAGGYVKAWIYFTVASKLMTITMYSVSTIESIRIHFACFSQQHVA